MQKLSVVLCGLRFGGAFVPIYRDHPDVSVIGIYDPDTALMQEVSQFFGISRTYGSYEEVLQDASVDAVHLVTPIPMHEEQTILALRTGKHCACTVPMAVTLEGLCEIIRACEETGKKYMMMETSAYTRQFLMAKEMKEEGIFGRIQFLRGCHYQDMENWPDYWHGLPPMHYATHAVTPMVLLAGARANRVVCFGSGTMREELVEQYHNPYPFESALVGFANGIKGEVSRSLFETARTYLEGMFVYGSKASFEWGFADNDNPIITRLVPSETRGFNTPHETVKATAFFKTLPSEIQRYTVSAADYDETQPENSLSEGAAGGHHGSHPHLVHEFIRSILEDRQPAMHARLSANITAVGICAHLSAMAEGKEMAVPTFEHID